jgi:hypothetical protein
LYEKKKRRSLFYLVRSGVDWSSRSREEHRRDRVCGRGRQTDRQIQRGEMTVALPGQLNLDETLSWGSRSVDFFEKIEQIGEGTYGYGYILLMSFLVSFLLLRRLMFPAHDFLTYSSCVLPDLSSGVLLVFPLGTLFVVVVC